MIDKNMALKIKDSRLVGTIDNLEEKLKGKLPVTREELLVLVNTHGRFEHSYITTYPNIIIEKCDSKECYNLSKLDTSEITDMNYIFSKSYFNDNISNWDTSKVTTMKSMFYFASSFNQDISKWDVSNVIDMNSMFYSARGFSQDISKWNISKECFLKDVFNNAKAFIDKYNNGVDIPYHTEEFKIWFDNNRDRMNDLDIKDKYGNQINNFFSNIKGMDNGIKNNK